MVKYQKSKNHNEYALLLDAFNAVIGKTARPFGQLSKPEFGASDDNQGVQWNLAVFPDRGLIRVGANLEGMRYQHWPITTLILNELAQPSLENLRLKMDGKKACYIRLTRDAWQMAARPNIEEQFIGGSEMLLNNTDTSKWLAMLREAQECLNENKDYRGRATQGVTVIRKDGSVDSKDMQVSPHLTIWTPLTLGLVPQTNIRDCMTTLQPVHEWMLALTKEIKA